jgi:hypothetical protein
MSQAEKRLEGIENEIQFLHWLRTRRIFESMTADDLEAYAITGIWHDRPEPSNGMSRLDSIDRTSLIKMWRKDIASFAGRSSDELEFYAIHGRWPERLHGSDFWDQLSRQLYGGQQ